MFLCFIITRAIVNSCRKHLQNIYASDRSRLRARPGLNWLALLHVHQEIVPDFEEVIDKFSAMGEWICGREV